MDYLLYFCLIYRLPEQLESPLQSGNNSCLCQKDKIHFLSSRQNLGCSWDSKWFLYVWHFRVLFFPLTSTHNFSAHFILVFIPTCILLFIKQTFIVCLFLFFFSSPSTDLNLLDWSSRNVLAVALHNSVYLWDATQGDVTLLMKLEREEDYICSVSWTKEGSYLAIGTRDCKVQVSDWTQHCGS